LEETAKACYVKHTAQKARKVVEAKTRKEAKKKRLAEKKKKKKKKKQMEYFQQP